MNSHLTSEAQVWQRELPAGLRLQKELIGTHAWEAVDERFGAEAPIARIIRFFEIETEWKPEVLSRLRLLASDCLSHVTSPLEIGWIAAGVEDDDADGRKAGDIEVLYVVEQPYCSTLKTSLSETGLPVDSAQTIFETLVKGVVELHARKLFHGNLSPANIFLHGDRSHPDVRIGNVSTGTLPYRAAGQIVADELQQYGPPEANGAIPEPSASADLYALGVIGCELFLGQGAFQELRQKHAQLRQLLQQRSVSRRTMKTLMKLVQTDPQERPADAFAVQKLMRDDVPVWLERGIFGVLVAALLVFSVAGILKSHSLQAQLAETNAQVRDREKQVEEARSKIRGQEELLQSHHIERDQLLEENKSLRVKLATEELLPSYHIEQDQLLEENKSLREKLATEEGVLTKLRTLAEDPQFDDRQKVERIREAIGSEPEKTVHVKKARTIWNGWCDNNVSVHTLLDALRQSDSGLSKDDPAGRLLNEWQRNLAELRLHSRVWLTARTDDPVVADLIEKVRRAAQAPWEAKTWSDAESFCNAVQNAASIWQKYADQSDLNWTDFCDRSLKAAVAFPEPLRSTTKTILERWQAEFERKSGAVWKLQLVKSEVKPPRNETETPDYGCYRIFHLYSGDDEHIAVKHNWSAATSHRYSKTKEEFVEFHWKTGEPIELLLEEDGTFANINLVDQVFDGPVAVWRLHTQRRISNPDTGVSLDFRIEGSPGPPKEVFDERADAIPKKLGHLLGSHSSPKISE